MSDWYVYIVSNNAHTLYTGATSNLPRRVYQHKNRTYRTSFTARYTFDRLVYFELAGPQKVAIAREQQIKKWPRRRRVALILAMNPKWEDLSVRCSPEHLLA